ncbi:lamin tail domain-containing protein [Candidatus Giovannonibacteria bacterium]|nr:lamin tail domain-containing protein [Candidatus Giovannonibacteria bacterium]
MGWAGKSTSLWGTPKIKEGNQLELEQQFASLWEKWGPYTTPFGISEKYKEQVKSDLRNTLALAIEEHTETGSLYAKEPSLWEKFSAQLAKIKNVIANIASQVKNPFSAGPIVELPAETPAEVPTETRSLQTEEWSDVGSPTISESQENLDDLLEQADLVTEVSADNGSPQAEEPVLLPKVEELDLIETVEATTTELASEPELVSREDSPLQAEEVAEDGPPPVSAELCQRENGGAARQYRVLIDKVAWMGDKESTSHEWIELKNIWGMPINLSGWQLQDKDRQIKIIFGQEDIISEQGFYFLERSKDYTGALNNSNEALYLFDNQCNVEDEVLANPKWPAGDNSTKEPMKRFDVNYWYSGNAPSAEIFYGSPALAPEPTQEIISNNSNAAASSLAVVFNEIAWAGTKANSADEWIELYNNTASTVDLTGWKIKKDNEDWIIFTTSTIPAAGYYLLERTDDSAVNSTSADQIFTGAMNNSGEKLELYNNSGILIDSIDASSGWPAGQASPNYISMERINSASTTISTNWASNNRIARNGFDADNNAINGTPKAENSVSKEFTNIPSNFAITEDLILTYLGNPYLVEGLMLVSGAKLTIESGVTVKFRHVGAANQNAFLKVENGALEAVGTAAQKITLTSSNAQPQAGDWDGIYLQNSTSTLENIIVRYGGKWHQPSSYEWPAYTYGALYIDGGSAQISNSLIEKSQTFGLWLKNSTTSQIISAEFKENPGTGDRPAAVYIENSSPTIKNSIFQNNEIGILTGNFSAPTIKDNQFIQNTAPIQIASLLGSISGNTFQNNDTDGVLVSSFGFSSQYGEINWEKIAVPYFIGAALSVPSGYTLTIEPGVEIRLKGSGQINVDGNLKAIGTSQNKIIFTGANEVPGAWKYIKFCY